MLLSSFTIIITEQLTLSVTRPFDSSPGSAGGQRKRYKDTLKVSLNNFDVDPDNLGRISW